MHTALERVTQQPGFGLAWLRPGWSISYQDYKYHLGGIACFRNINMMANSNHAVVINEGLNQSKRRNEVFFKNCLLLSVFFIEP